MTEHPNVALVRRFYEACNRGDQDLLRVCLAPDVVRYFAGRNPAAGAEKLIAYCLASVAQLQSHWSIDHALAGEGEAVIEWTMRWRPDSSDEFILTRGTEWIVIQEGRIAESRLYFQTDAEFTTTELQGFPYRDRGYTLPS